MKKLLLAGMLSAGLLAGSAANAATGINFQFDAADSSLTFTGGHCVGFCSATAGIVLPTSEFSLSNGQSQTFDFANIDLRGFGVDTGITATAKLAFTLPTDVGTVTGGGNAWYATLFGVVSGGQLTWTSIVPDPVSTKDGTFSVALQDLGGLTTNKVTDHVTIKVDSVVPEPATWAMMLLGFFGLGAMVRSRRNAGATLAA